MAADPARPARLGVYVVAIGSYIFWVQMAHLATSGPKIRSLPSRALDLSICLAGNGASRFLFASDLGKPSAPARMDVGPAQTNRGADRLVFCLPVVVQDGDTTLRVCLVRDGRHCVCPALRAVPFIELLLAIAGQDGASINELTDLFQQRCGFLGKPLEHGIP